MNVTRKIALLLAVVFLLPALFFSGYELSSLNKDEAMIQDVYNKQLEAILFSVNQYSDDAINRWIAQVQAGVESRTDSSTLPASIAKLLELNSALTAVFVIDTLAGVPRQNVYTLDDKITRDVTALLKDTSWQDPGKIHQLMNYQRSGFQKVEALDGPSPNDEPAQWIVFIIQDAEQKPCVAGTVIQPELFIEDLIGPRLQGIARDQFVLSVIRKSTSAMVYNTVAGDTARLPAEALTKDFWLLPDYALGIRSQGPSLQDVVRDRTLTNMGLLLAVDIILILAVILVYRNIKKEVQLAQNKSDFVSNVSHEIRTPLALISMFAETLEMGRVKSEEKKQEYYGIIHKEAHRLSGIVNKILNFSQAEANKKVFHPVRLHPDTEIREILKTYDFHLANKGFTYTFTGLADLYVRADREAFIETVINLIDNAVKYSGETKRIEITCARSGSTGQIAVRDFGIGISRQDQRHVFDKFYRVSSGNLAGTRGTGLGLSLVKQLMVAQGGDITLESEPGKGSTFTLTFPLESP
ncbi:MAG: HAMP domain-containing histidine kinase [Cyclobacteriaceae bacterium]|nr:HAMP domain-containing histidine kinase [Cyclobacteriaceae bacterium]